MVSKELPPSAAITRYSHNEQIKHSIVFAPAPDPLAQQIVMGAAVVAYSGPRTEVPCNIVSCRPWFSSWGLHANALIEGLAPNVRHDALSGVAAREGCMSVQATQPGMSSAAATWRTPLVIIICGCAVALLS